MTQIDLVQSIPCSKGKTCMIVDHIEPGEAASIHILELTWDWLGEEDMGAELQDDTCHTRHWDIYVLSLQFLTPLAVQCRLLQGVHCRPQYKAIMISIYQFRGQAYHRWNCQLIPAMSTPDRARPLHCVNTNVPHSPWQELIPHGWRVSTTPGVIDLISRELPVTTEHERNSSRTVPLLLTSINNHKE